MLNNDGTLQFGYRIGGSRVNDRYFCMLNSMLLSMYSCTHESEADSAGDFLPVPYPNAFEIPSAVRFRLGKNLISCFILHKDSTAVRARAASTWPNEFHTGTAIPIVPRIASPSLIA